MKKVLNYIKNIKEQIAVALLITFTFFVFGPIELYYTNITDPVFFFDITCILGAIFLIFLVATIVLVLLQIIWKSKKIANIITGILFGIGLALYVQGNYINADYGVLNGATIDWNSYRTYAIWDTCFWIGIIVVSILLSLIIKRTKIEKVRSYVAVFVVLIEIVTLLTLVVTAGGKKNSLTHVGAEKQFTLGSEENIIIFLLDTYDSQVFDDLLNGENGESIKEQFGDFTYYDNMSGGYPYTVYSVPLILSGEWYDNSVIFAEYVKKCYKESGLYDELLSSGYSIGLYSDGAMLGKSLIEYTRNLYVGKGEVSSEFGATGRFLKLTAFRYFPHELKKYTAMEKSSFDEYRDDTSYKFEQDIDFYEKLQNEGITVEEGKSFVFYHLNGIHAPYFLDENVKENENATEEQQALGELKIVESYIEKLKENNVYDNSTIIVMADHGYKGMGQAPLFLVKEADADHDFTINSAPVSYDDLRGTYSYWISGDAGDRTTIYDFEEGEQRTRYFRWYALENQRKTDIPLVEYAIEGDASDITSMYKTGVLYDETGVHQQEKLKYENDLTITFGSEGNYEKAIGYGYRHWGGYIYSYGEYTDFSLDMSEYVGGDIKVDIALANVMEAPQTLQLYVNDMYVDEAVAQTAGTVLTYIIPEDCLSTDIMNMKIVYPDATISNDMIIEGHTGEGLAVVYDYMHFSNLEEFKTGTKYEFGTGGNSDKIVGGGFGANEEGLRWSVGEQSTFYWSVTKMPVKDVTLNVKLKMTVDDKQKLEVYMNDVLVQEVDANVLEFEITVPADSFVEGINSLTIAYPNAISPQEINGSADTRQLSVAYESIEIK